MIDVIYTEDDGELIIGTDTHKIFFDYSEKEDEDGYDIDAGITIVGTDGRTTQFYCTNYGGISEVELGHLTDNLEGYTFSDNFFIGIEEDCEGDSDPDTSMVVLFATHETKDPIYIQVWNQHYGCVSSKRDIRIMNGDTTIFNGKL